MKLATDLGIPAKRSGLKGKVRTFLDQKVRQAPVRLTTGRGTRSHALTAPAGHPLLRCRPKQKPHKTDAPSLAAALQTLSSTAFHHDSLPRTEYRYVMLVYYIHYE